MRRLLLLAGCLAAAGCATQTSDGTATPSQPAPTPASQPAPPGTVPAGGRGPTVSYGPVRSAAYTIHRRDSLLLHLPGGATQEQLLERVGYVRLTVVEGMSADSYLAAIVLDSLQASADGMPVAPDSLIPLQGMRWTGTLSPQGQLSNLRPDRAGALGEQFASHFRALFPALPPGGVRAGMEWIDSTQFPIKADAFDATELAHTTYRAAEDGDRLKLESSGTYSRNGTRMQFQQQLEMTAAGTRRGVHYLGRDGTLIAAEGSDSGEMTITVPAMGQTVPVTQSGRYEIRPIRQPS